MTRLILVPFAVLLAFLKPCHAQSEKQTVHVSFGPSKNEDCGEIFLINDTINPEISCFLYRVFIQGSKEMVENQVNNIETNILYEFILSIYFDHIYCDEEYYSNYFEENKVEFLLKVQNRTLLRRLSDTLLCRGNDDGILVLWKDTSIINHRCLDNYISAQLIDPSIFKSMNLAMVLQLNGIQNEEIIRSIRESKGFEKYKTKFFDLYSEEPLEYGIYWHSLFE